MEPHENTRRVHRKPLRPLTCYLATLALISAQAINSQAVPGQAASGASRPPLKATTSDFFEEHDWKGVCSRALAVPLPQHTQALARSAESKPALLGGQCDEQTLYYGFGKPRDYKAALECAYRHRAHPNGPTNTMLEGAGTLAMLYANGEGVPRDYSLAIRFACEAAPVGGQNSEQRIGVLEALRSGKLSARTTFDLCDEQMSGAMGSYCSALSERKADVGRGRRVSVITGRLSQRARAMLPALQIDETAFEHARAMGEYPGGGGSGSAGFSIEDQNKLREQFVINLERFSAGTVPNASPANREQAQKKLDEAYKAALAVPRDSNAGFGNPTADGLRTTQAAWEKLFTRWLLFTPAAFPALSQDAVATELLRLRVHQLKKATY